VLKVRRNKLPLISWLISWVVVKAGHLICHPILPTYLTLVQTDYDGAT
jgi:hypothetical protein